MAVNKRVQFKFDFDTKDVQLASDRTIGLKEQLRLLTKELQNTQTGTREFEILSNKIRETQDNLDLVNIKSKDLNQTFSSLPGPIGSISKALGGTIGDLKLLTAFSLKDLQVQFKAVQDDVVGIGKNLANLTGLSKLYAGSNQLLSKSLNAVGVSASTSSKGVQLFSKALIATGIGAIVVALGLLIANFDKVKDAVFNLIPGLKSVADFIGNIVNAVTDWIGVTSEAERAEKKRQETYEKSKAQTDSINKGIQRQIDLLKAQGATQEEIDKQRRKIIENQLNDLRKLANEQGKIFGQEAELYRDLQNQLRVIDAETNKRQKDEQEKQLKDKQQKDKQALEQAKQVRQADIDAQIELEKRGSETSEEVLRDLLKKQQQLRNEGKNITKAQLKLQEEEINKIIQDELKKDVDARKKINDEIIKENQRVNKEKLNDLRLTLEESKFLYGEESDEVRKVQDEIFNIRKQAIDDEISLLESRKESIDGITNEEINRLQELSLERRKLTLDIQQENQRQTEIDRETYLERYDIQMENAANDFELRQQILNDKIEQDALFFQQQLEQEGLTEEQRRRILEQQTQAVEENARAQVEIEAAKSAFVISQLNELGNATSQLGALMGKETLAGKALGIATAGINTWVGVTEALKQKSVLPSPFDVAAKVVNVAAVVASGLKAVKAITSVQVPSGAPAQMVGTTQGQALSKPRGLNTGGLVSGPGTGTSDSIPTMLSNGESVINANSTAMFSPLLSTINQLGGGRSFDNPSIGSNVQDNQIPQLPPIKTYVVSTEMSNQQQMDRQIKSRSEI